MALKLPEVHLPQLLSWLQQYLPHSFKIYGELRCHLRGDFPDLDFFVDRWPDPRAVVAVIDHTSEQLPRSIYSIRMVYGVHGVNDEVLRTLLKHPAVVDWNTHNVFTAMSERMRPVMQMVADEMGKNPEFYPTFLLKATPQDLKPLPVPEGMKIRPIYDADVRVVNATWKFALEGTENFIQALVHQFPSLCMVTENGRHVGHMVSQSCGLMGMLYVQPEFRGKGYAKVIVTNLAQKHFNQGDDAYVCVEVDNSGSVRLHQSVGFQLVPGLKLEWMFYDLKGACQ